ncbi:MAG: lamin tail domain-containing protein, partial [Candidatus Cloacimonetes bacterium]|nr:lamin tail domain-containing protein [Candidatus Cloacimonadota bacterium]
PDPQQSSNFGAKVGVFRNALLISNEGQRRYYPDGSPPADYQVGVAYHYGLCTDGRFRLLHTLWPQNYAVEYGDNFACDVAMDEHYYMCVGSFTDDGGGNGAGATYVYWSGNNYGEPGDGTESEEDDGSGETNGGATGEGSIFPAPYVDCVIINEYEADPEIPDRDIQQWVELLVIAEGGVDMRHWLLTDIDPSDLYEGVLMPPGLNEAFIRFNDYPEFSDIPGGTTIVIFDGNGPTNDLDPSDGTMFIYTESEYLSRVPYSFYTIQLDVDNDNLTLWADDDGIWDVENSIPIDHISWGDPLIEPPYGVDWGDYIDDGSDNRAVSNSYFSDGDNTVNDEALNWFTDGTSTQGSLNPGQIYTGSDWQPDPSNHVLDFSADVTGFYSVEVTWTENDGSVVADGYLLAASINSISNPIDGYQSPEDTDISDGSACVYLPHGTNSHAFSNCNPLTTYHFKIYPYTGTGSLINYKTDGTVPEDDATTPSDILEPSPGDLIITEVVGKDATSYEFSGFIEFTNNTEYPINLSDVKVRYYDDSGIPTATYDLSGTIEPNDYLVICQNEDYFTLAYGMTADFILPFYYHTWPWTSLFNLDGGQDAIDFYLDSGRSEIIDQFNDPADAWSWNSDDVLERVADTPGTAQSDWFNPGGTGTPGTGGNQSLSSPQNVIITTDIDNVNISWDEVTGADSYVVYSSDNPETGFVEDTSGSFNGESWTAPAPEIKRFYHVRAVQNEE